MSRSEFRGLVRELRPAEPRRSLPARLAVLVWRNLPEIVTALLTWWLWSKIGRLIGPVWTVILTIALVAAVVAVPKSRRVVLAGLGMWLTRRRLNAALREIRLVTRAGRVPLLLWLVPTPVGERATLWCRVGISAEDIADEIDRLRAALVARDVRVTRSPRWAALVTIDVIRRDPLAGSTVVPAAVAKHGTQNGSTRMRRAVAVSG